MHEDFLRTKWKQFRKEIDYYWTQFDGDDLDGVNGRQNLVLLLERRYGYARSRAEREVERVVAEFADKLRRAF